MISKVLNNSYVQDIFFYFVMMVLVLFSLSYFFNCDNICLISKKGLVEHKKDYILHMILPNVFTYSILIFVYFYFKIHRKYRAKKEKPRVEEYVVNQEIADNKKM